MCGYYAVVYNTKVIEKKFNLKPSPQLNFDTNSIVSIGKSGLVITSDNQKELQSFTFGFTPSWADKQMYSFNARAEGNHNKENDPKYNGAKGIISKPFFRKAIRSQRCLVIADCYIEGTIKEKTKKPFAVYLRDNDGPMAFAGVWDEWVNKESGEIVKSFAIITTTPNKLIQSIPHDRMPVILSPGDYNTYLNTDSPLQDITSMLKPFDHRLMNAYPISQEFKSNPLEAKKVLQPTGQRLIKEYDFNVEENLQLFGMGKTSGRLKKQEEEDKLAEQLKQEKLKKGRK